MKKVLVLGRSEVRSIYRYLVSGGRAGLGVCLVVLLVLAGFTMVDAGFDDVHTTHGRVYNLKKFVLEESCHNPVDGALVVLYSHEMQSYPGVEVWRGFTNQLGWVDLGEWEAGWYSLNASWGGYWNCESPFFVNRDWVLYNYLDIPPDCVCVKK